MSNRFLTANGTPSSGSARARACAMRASTRAARRSARSREHVGEGVDALVGGVDARQAGSRTLPAR